MATSEILDPSSLENKVPAPTAGTLSSAPQTTVATMTDAASATLAPTPTVASTILSVSDVIGQQMEIAAITAELRRKLVPIMPEFSFSTGISGEDRVGEFAAMVTQLNAVRKSRASEAAH